MTTNPANIILNDPVFADRQRYFKRSSDYIKRPTPRPSRLISDILIMPVPVAKSAVYVTEIPRAPHLSKQQSEKPGTVNQPQLVATVSRTKGKGIRKSKQLYSLYIMAAMVFLVGLAVSFKGWQTNSKISAQVKQLQKSSVSSSKTPDASATPAPPSTVKPVASAISSYSVAPDLPRYIDIPSLGVHSRILRVGINKAGELGAPDNVFDTAWYSSSAKPGQEGAMLIDGHASSWTTHGVFYGLKKLKPGDLVKVQRGDDTVFQYKVVKSQVYQDDQVDMNAALAAVNQDKPGLNLITCTGQVKPGTSEFAQRMVVFAEQV